MAQHFKSVSASARPWSYRFFAAFCIAILSYWLILVNMPVIIAYTGHHLFTLLCCLPIILSLIIFRSSQPMPSEPVKADSPKFRATAPMAKLLKAIAAVDGLTQALDARELNQLSQFLQSKNTLAQISSSAEKKQQGILFLRKPNNSTDLPVDDHEKKSTFNVIYQSDIPRKMLLRFEDEAGAILNPERLFSSDVFVALYIYPKSKLPGGVKSDSNLRHPFKTKYGGTVKCEPVLVIHPLSSQAVEMVAISSKKIGPGQAIRLEPHLGMSLAELLNSLDHSKIASPALAAEPHPLRKTWFRERFDLAQALHIIKQVSLIIQQAHDNDHRSHLDLKPGNIVINAAGEIAVIDWPDFSTLAFTPGISVLADEHRVMRMMGEICGDLDPDLKRQLIEHMKWVEPEPQIFSFPMRDESQPHQETVKTSYLAHDFLYPSYHATFHDTWAILSLAASCFKYLTNTIDSKIARYATVTLANKMLGDVKSRLEIAVLEGKEKFFSSHIFQESQSKGHFTAFVKYLNDTWTVAKVCGELHQNINTDTSYLSHRLLDVAQQPTLLETLSDIRHHMNPEEALSPLAYHEKFYQWFGQLAQQINDPRYQMRHWCLDQNQVYMLNDQLFLSWSGSFEVEKNLATVCHKNNIAISIHPIFSYLDDGLISFRHDMSDQVVCMPASRRLIEQLRQLKPSSTLSLEGQIDQYRSIHDVWSFLNLFLVTHTYLMNSEYPSTIILGQISTHEICKAMIALLQRARDHQNVMLESPQLILDGLHQSISAQLQLIDTATPTAPNASIDPSKKTLFAMITSALNENIGDPSHAFAHNTSLFNIQDFLSHIRQLCGQIEHAQQVFDKSLGIGSDITQFDPEGGFSINWRAWLSNRFDPDLARTLRNRIEQSLLMMKKFCESDCETIVINFDPILNGISIPYTYRLGIYTFFHSWSVGLERTCSDKIEEFKNFFSSPDNIYSDTWLMLQTLLRSFVLLDASTRDKDIYVCEVLDLMFCLHDDFSRNRIDSRLSHDWSLVSTIDRLRSNIERRCENTRLDSLNSRILNHSSWSLDIDSIPIMGLQVDTSHARPSYPNMFEIFDTPQFRGSNMQINMPVEIDGHGDENLSDLSDASGSYQSSLP